MRSLEIAETPEIIRENYERWVSEYKQANEENRSAPAPYRNKEIKEALEKETNNKCAYCESYIEHVSYSHVEHIIPKSIYPEGICLWSNLTLACQVCNTNKGEYYSNEAPILNPYTDNVEDQITFYGPMIFGRGEKGRLTISKLKLNRNPLVFKRKETIESIFKVIDLLERTRNQPSFYQAMLQDLEMKVSEYEEYTYCVRCFVKDEIKERGIELGDLEI